MSDRCSHGMRVGTCSDCNDDHDRTVRLAERVAERLRELLPELADSERAELFWWRSVFSCRFRSGNLPPVYTPLYGSRFVLMEESGPDASAELVEWRRD